MAEVAFGDSLLAIEGTFVFEKMGWDVTTGQPWFNTQVFEGRITIDSSEILVYFADFEPWIVKGSTRSISS